MPETSPTVARLAAAGVVAMCGCDPSPEIVDRHCSGCGLPSLQAILAFQPVVRVLSESADSIRRCDLWGCEHHHHALGRCRRHYDAERRDLTARDSCAGAS